MVAIEVAEDSEVAVAVGDSAAGAPASGGEDLLSTAAPTTTIVATGARVADAMSARTPTTRTTTGIGRSLAGSLPAASPAHGGGGEGL